ncbi:MULTISPECIES: hypothetical protein [unclassified Streptomyces]|uniref:hypothetical protein n=1 Tax=unclassified Streptomyces TaxID=2593676 RepID=UPI003326BD62
MSDLARSANGSGLLAAVPLHVTAVQRQAEPDPVICIANTATNGASVDAAFAVCGG